MMKWKSGTFKKQQDGVKRIAFFRIFIDIMECFIAACGATLMNLFFKIGVSGSDPSILPQLNEMVIVWFIYFLIATAAYSLVSQKWIYEERRYIDNSPMGEATIPPEKTGITESFERLIISTHEAGHAVMAYLLRLEVYDIVLSSIHSYVKTPQGLMTAAKIRKDILVHYAGAAAENIFFGEICNGSMGTPASDFEKATILIKEYIVMTDDTVSKSMLDEELAEKVIAYSKQFYAEAETILAENKDMVEVLRNKLENRLNMKTQEVNDLFLEHGMSGREIKIEL